MKLSILLRTDSEKLRRKMAPKLYALHGVQDCMGILALPVTLGIWSVHQMSCRAVSFAFSRTLLLPGLPSDILQPFMLPK